MRTWPEHHWPDDGYAWLAFVLLRIVGRRYRSRPSLGDAMRAVQQPEASATEYYI
jgi:hypothetical protein